MEFGPDNHPRDLRSARYRLVIPVVLILIISVLLVGGLVVLAARSQDRVASESSVHLTRSVVEDISRRLADQLLDYSFWDQAVNNLVTNFSAKWADDNVGIYMHRNFDITSSYVLDLDDRTVYGMSNGARTDADPLTHFSGGLSTLIERTRMAPRTEPPVPVTGLLRTGDIFHIGAAAVLTKFKRDAAENEEIATGWILIFTRALDGKLLKKVSEKYLLEELRVVPDGIGDELTALPLIGADGNHLGLLTWKAEMPGREMLSWLLPIIGGVFVLMIGLTLAFFQRTNAVIQAFYRQITEREKVQQQLENEQILSQARKMEALGNMVGGITHNFNNLLLPILALSWTTKEALPRGSKERENLEQVIEAGANARDLIDRVMAFARREPPEKRIIDLATAIDSSLLLAMSTLPSKIKLDRRVDPDIGKIYGDEVQIQTIVLNLISNSVDALEGEIGKIAVSVDKISARDPAAADVQLEFEDAALLSIADDGTGMDEATMGMMFDPFFTTKEIGKGTGLGLSSAYGIVNDHGGEICATSTLGIGTVIKIFLPLLPAASEQSNSNGDERSASTA